jgi:hypothetical protein
MNKQILQSELFTSFLGMTEKEIDLNNVFGTDLKKMGKQDLDANMQIILYMLSQQQFFEVILDKDKGSIVVAQKTYWIDIDENYNSLKRIALPIRCDFSAGFYIQSKKHGKILVEICDNPPANRCILANI